MSRFIINQNITNPQQAWYLFKNTAIFAGWSVRTSSTGTVYAALGDVITTPTALGDRAWFVLRLGDRELCIQINSVGNVRITYSAKTQFVSGSPSATTVPSATDAVTIWGSGSDAAPVFAPLFSATTWLQGFFDSVGFWVLQYPIGGGLPTALIYLDPTSGVPDTDPCVIYCGTSATYGHLASCIRGPIGHLAPSWAGRLAAGTRGIFNVSDQLQLAMPGSLIVSHTLPVYPQETLRYMRPTWLAGTVQPGNVGNPNTVGDKGEGLMVRWSGITYPTPTLVQVMAQDTMLLGVGDILLPWTDVSPAL